jgi:formylglycine-generating enzyme required for sulfatase activity
MMHDTNLLDIAMVEIPAGEIVLRDDRIKQSWKAEIKPFYLAKYAVTQALYFEITGQRPSTFTGDQLPVETVSWRDAVSFCNSLSEKNDLKPCYAFDQEADEVLFNPSVNGFRLPTEAEWEYACKAGTNGIRYGELDQIAWYKQNSGKTTQQVGLKMPNAWGLYDMLGNVWEWCTDIYDESVYGAYRIIRGGGWSDEERGCMATNRRRSHPKSFKIEDLGFRVARNL